MYSPWNSYNQHAWKRSSSQLNQKQKMHEKDTREENIIE
jgi:hypothetical protein